MQVSAARLKDKAPIASSPGDEMNPYEADAGKVPESDRYRDTPSYGRFLPRPDDFTPDPAYVNSTTPEALRYWAAVLERCSPSNRVYENDDGGRDVFALGSVIIKSSHLHASVAGRRACRDYSLADANEVAATALVRALTTTDVQVPEFYFSSKVPSPPTVPNYEAATSLPNHIKTLILRLYRLFPVQVNGRSVLVQSRIPGVGLNVAWQYLSAAEKKSFKRQARSFLRAIHELKPPTSAMRPSYVVPDDDPVEHRGIQPLERQMLFESVVGTPGSINCCHHGEGFSKSDSGTCDKGRSHSTDISGSGNEDDRSGDSGVCGSGVSSAGANGSSNGRYNSNDGDALDNVDAVDFGFMHNDLTPSNLIVDKGRIVAAIDWEMAGYFGWRAAREVHVHIRSPKRESYTHLQLPEELLRDICYWSDLYDVEADDS